VAANSGRAGSAQKVGLNPDSEVAGWQLSESAASRAAEFLLCQGTDLFLGTAAGLDPEEALQKPLERRFRPDLSAVALAKEDGQPRKHSGLGSIEAGKIDHHVIGKPRVKTSNRVLRPSFPATLERDSITVRID
jgi:hypothetical protein